MRRVLASFLIALSGSVLAEVASQPIAATGDRARSSRLRAEGLAHGYNLDYDRAFDSFRRAAAADPGDSAAFRLHAATAWIALLFEQGAVTVEDYLGQARSDVERPQPDPVLDLELRRSLDRAIAIAEAELKEHPRSAEAHYQAGAAYGLRASYSSTIEGRVLGSLQPARRAFREHQTVLSLDPARKDAGLIVGLYAYGISSLPVHLRLLATLAGFSGGRQRAIQLVEEAAAFPSDSQPNAMFALIVIYNREKRYDDALRVIRDLRDRYPGNRLLWLETASTLLRAGRSSEAGRAMEQGIRQLEADDRPRARGELARWRSVHGGTLVLLGKTSEAERELHEALEADPADWVRGRINTDLGRLRDLAGDRAAALSAYRLALNQCRAARDDGCQDQVRSLIKRPYQRQSAGSTNGETR